MSDSIFEKINIFYLLGIDALPKDEENKFVNDMTQIVMGNGLADALQKEKISTDVYKKLLEILDEDKNSPKASDEIKIQRYIMDNIPNIKTYLTDATNKFKQQALEEQLKEVESKLDSIEDETERNYFKNLITNLRKSITENSEIDFFENHKLYTDLKVKYNLD